MGGAGTSAFPGANVPSMKSFEPLPWSDYFDDLRVLETERGSFGVYVAGWPAEGQEPRPVIFAVHGGGYTGLTWSLLAYRSAPRRSSSLPQMPYPYVRVMGYARLEFLSPQFVMHWA